MCATSIEKLIQKECVKMGYLPMEGAGFSMDQAEWWHFDYGDQPWASNSGSPLHCMVKPRCDFLVIRLNQLVNR